MKKTNQLSFIIPILLIGISVLSCGERYKDFVLKHYATSYVVSRDFQLYPHNDKNGVYIINFWNSEHIVSFESEGQDLLRFNELARKNKDTSYREVIMKGIQPYQFDRMFFDEAISAITITCDKDVDEKHPKGTPLNDLFLFFSGSPDDFIKSGYQQLVTNQSEILKDVDTRLKYSVESFFNTHKSSSKAIYGKVSEIEFSKYKLMGGTWFLEFGKLAWVTPPQNLSAYTLTLEIEFADGVKKTADLLVSE